MDLGGAKAGVKSDINVTPLVDVMLVLLIIMMLIAPMLQQGVDVRLPQVPTPLTSQKHKGKPSCRLQLTSASM
jgi:biopolymer transport protein ExbD